jgi:RimJ/RimL family protein N-acetyltransferase
MLPDTKTALVLERQRSLLREADTHRIARRVDADRRLLRGTPAGRRFANVLRNALTVRIRPIRSDDATLLADGFARLSPSSRRLRFLAAKKQLTSAELFYFTEVDHRDHEALVAVSRFGGKGLAVARYIRDPRDRDAADVAVTVVDEWQGRGLGTALATRLAGRARCEGIHRFTAMVLEENDGARRLLPKVGSARLIDRAHGTLEFEVALAPVAAERRALRPYVLGPRATGYGCA